MLPLEDVKHEALAAAEVYGPPASAAESYGVLIREVTELGEAQHQRDMGAIYREAIQVSAVALRMAEWAYDHRDDDHPRI